MTIRLIGTDNKTVAVERNPSPALKAASIIRYKRKLYVYRGTHTTRDVVSRGRAGGTRMRKTQANMICLALEWGVFFGTADGLTMLWLGPIRIGWFKQ